MHEPLYSTDEMRAAEARYPGYPDTADQLMERAGGAVAQEAFRAFPDARRFAVVCGKGANGGDGRIAARLLREAPGGTRSEIEVDLKDIMDGKRQDIRMQSGDVLVIPNNTGRAALIMGLQFGIAIAASAITWFWLRDED